MSSHPDDAALSDSLDAAPDGNEWVREHLSTCARCQDSLSILDRGKRLAATLRQPVEPPTALLAQTRAVLDHANQSHARRIAWRTLRVHVVVGAALLVTMTVAITTFIVSPTRVPSTPAASALAIESGALPLVPVKEVDALSVSYAARERILLRQIADARAQSPHRADGLVENVAMRLAEIQEQVTGLRVLPRSVDRALERSARVQRLHDARLLLLHELLLQLTAPRA
ncbi:MAG TPA: hypothetical protein VE869_14100 [Gemmatimonas sp.]|nr:hypothetical protein [Gemmatimonas sp.]